MSKEAFMNWMSTQYSSRSQEHYTMNTIRSYCACAGSIVRQNLFNKSIFDVTNINEFNNIKQIIISNPNYKTINDNCNNALSSFLELYPYFLENKDTENTTLILQYREKRKQNIYNKEEDKNMTNNTLDFSPNLIYFGAPGTGKSFTLNANIKNLLSSENQASFYERVTFHPDYSYANFVGTYKPTPLEDNTITYKYVPGPFMRVYKKAVQDLSHKYLLIIEEINRADVAAVFGDVFQLLDRKDDNSSEYTIQASEDIKHYLMSDSNITEEQASTLSIPSNMYIWATMNSADQGVFPMDTAFKRRWDFIYMDINKGEEWIDDFDFPVGENKTIINWNKLRKAINDELLNYGINEDKLMGPFFISLDKLTDENNYEKFKTTFNNKVLMYLFDDAAKQKRNELFNGIKNTNDRKQFSQIVAQFNSKGVEIFNGNISSKFEEKSEE